MKDAKTIADSLRSFILENYLFTDDQNALGNGDSFLERKILDSMGILELAHYLKEKFGVEVEDQELVPENLDSVNNLVAFIQRKTH
jgi:acyl carrier protein